MAFTDLHEEIEEMFEALSGCMPSFHERERLGVIITNRNTDKDYARWYRKTAHGKALAKQYRESEHGREVRRKNNRDWVATNPKKAKEHRRRYLSSDKGKAAARRRSAKWRQANPGYSADYMRKKREDPLQQEIWRLFDRLRKSRLRQKKRPLAARAARIEAQAAQLAVLKKELKNRRDAPAAPVSGACGSPR